MAREMEKVGRALDAALGLLAGLDQTEAARQLQEQTPYSPLRTLVEQARDSAARVITHLREQA